MRVVKQDNENVTENVVSTVEAYLNSSESPVALKSYHELADFPVQEQDALAQLHSNLELLTDLSGRMSFLMREVRYLLKA